MIRCFGIFAVLFAVLLYAPGLPAPMYLDDPVVLLRPHLAWSSRAAGVATFWLNDHVNPVVQVVFPVDDTYLFRLGNVLIHALAATSLFWLAYELSKKWAVAWVAATLFLAHPIQTLAVTYITQRFESQATLFMVLSAAAYARSRNTGDRRWLALSLICGVIAGLTKQTGVILPVWLVMIDVIFFRGEDIRKYAPYLAVLAVAVAIPTYLTFSRVRGTFHWIPWSQYLLTQGPVLATYLHLVIWPRQQFLYYDFSPVERISVVVAAQWTLVLSLIAAGFYALRRNRLVGFGILTFFVLLLPIVLIPLPDLMFEYRLYPAMAGVALTTAALLTSLRGRAGLILFLVMIVPMQLVTMQRNKEWVDPIRFLEKHRDRFPTNPILLANLSVRYANQGRMEEALETSRTARQFEYRANSYYRNYVAGVIATNFGFQYLQVKQFDAALVEADRALKLDPASTDALWVRGAAQVARHQAADARETLQTLLKYEPGNRRAWLMLRTAVRELGDVNGIREIDRRVEALDASSPPKDTRAVPLAYRKYVFFGLAVLGVLIVIWAVRTVWDARTLLTNPSDLA